MSGDPRKAPIEILAVSPFEPGRLMLAAVSLRGGEVVIQETRIVLRKCDARPWLALPQILIQGTCWQPVARLPSGLHREVEALALAAWESGR